MIQAEKAAKQAAKEGKTPGSSTVGSSSATPSGTAATSVEQLDMKKLALATDRSGNGILASDSQSRDIHIQSYSLSFHGRLLIENADFSLNYGQR